MQQLVTATSFMVLTNVNKFVVIIFGVVVLHDEITLLGGLGVLLAMGGGLWYGKARARMQEFTPVTVASSSQHKGDDDEEEDLLRSEEAVGEERGAHARHGGGGGA